MFALVDLDGGHALISFAAGPERFHELLEIEGLLPAPYLARAHWVAATRWDVFRASEWQAHLSAAHQLTLAKLPARTRALLELPAREQKRLIAEKRKLLAARAATGVPKRPRTSGDLA